ncbi:MAG: energy transducer TonB [Bacteriovoracaceae bacterium]|nr:energy transducer TonB [Bacteroidota bacterium]
MKSILFVSMVVVFGLITAQPERSIRELTATETVLLVQEKSAGSILGTVIDIDDRNPIENAVVEVLGSGIKVSTAKDGQFKIVNVAEGYYQIRASSQGYDMQTQNNLFVENSKPATAFFMLKKSGSQLSMISENSMPVPTSTKSPSYPKEAKKNGVEGIFYFKVGISETGEISTVKCIEKNVFAEEGKIKDREVMEKYPQAVNQLEKEALESIWQWKFKPAMKDGKAIWANVTLPVKFKLTKDK